MPTVMIVDDDPDTRTLIRVVIEMTAELTVIGEAIDGVEALALWRRFHTPPDIVILDNTMPGMTGLEAATEILQNRPAQVIVMCTSILDDATTTSAAAIGITSCASKLDIDLLPALIRMHAAS